MQTLGYIPELKFSTSYTSPISLTENLQLLPGNDQRVISLRNEIESSGVKLLEGTVLFFDGNLREDGTVFEVFQGYALALSFFSPKSRVSCRAVKELAPEESTVDIYIDEHDKFGYEEEDVAEISRRHITQVSEIYTRVEAQLTTKDFNPLRNALEFFILFLEERQIRTRLLYLSICLESILLEGNSEGLAYKLGMRGSNLLNAYYENVSMSDIYDELKNSYDLRSKIIHGDDYQKMSDKVRGRRGKTSTELDHVSVLESLVKDILSIVFSEQELHDLSIKSNLGKTIDQRHILDEKT